MIPILLNHCQEKDPVGFLVFEDNKVLAKFNKPIDSNIFFELVPGAGIIMNDPELDEETNTVWFTECQIVEISFLPGMLMPV